MIKRQNTVDFSDVFHFAEREFKVDWNTCNDIFFREEFFTYKGVSGVDLEELKGELIYIEDEKTKLASNIMISFMEKNNLKEVLVLGD